MQGVASPKHESGLNLTRENFKQINERKKQKQQR